MRMGVALELVAMAGTESRSRTPVIPVWNDDEVVFADEPGIAGVPDRRDDSYLQTLRDTQLLAGAWPRAEADGRTAMATNPDNYDSPR